jgi:hypothetical protein
MDPPAECDGFNYNQTIAVLVRPYNISIKKVEACIEADP